MDSRAAGGGTERSLKIYSPSEKSHRGRCVGRDSRSVGRSHLLVNKDTIDNFRQIGGMSGFRGFTEPEDSQRERGSHGRGARVNDRWKSRRRIRLGAFDADQILACVLSIGSAARRAAPSRVAPRYAAPRLALVNPIEYSITVGARTGCTYIRSWPDDRLARDEIERFPAYTCLVTNACVAPSRRCIFEGNIFPKIEPSLASVRGAMSHILRCTHLSKYRWKEREREMRSGTSPLERFQI